LVEHTQKSRVGRMDGYVYRRSRPYRLDVVVIFFRESLAVLWANNCGPRSFYALDETRLMKARTINETGMKVRDRADGGPDPDPPAVARNFPLKTNAFSGVLLL